MPSGHIDNVNSTDPSHELFPTDSKREGPFEEPAARIEREKELCPLQLKKAAELAEEEEKTMSLWLAIKLWWPAVFFSCAVSTGLIMEGYDNLLVAQFYAFPAFCRRYGKPTGTNGKYEIQTNWQVALSMGMLVGEVVGLQLNGLAIERYGYKKTMAAALFAVALFIFIPFFARNLIMIAVGEFLCGIPWGALQALTCAYASDVCPIKLRSYLTTYCNICWVIGQLIGSGILRIFVNRQDEWSYRIPFAIQWFWPIPISIALIFAPESPWGVNRRRTEISCLTWASQSLCGSALMSYSTYFFVQAGLPTIMAFNMSLVQYALGFCGTILSWYLMTHFGRRTLFASGLLGLLAVLFLIGSASLAKNNASAWAIGGLLIFYAAIYNSTVGPITYSIVSEIPSTRMKTKTVVLARNLYNISGAFNYIVLPYMLNPTAWRWGGKSGFFWAGICFICLIWTYFRLPEPRYRSYAELDELFEKKISARKFSSTVLRNPDKTGSPLGSGLGGYNT